MLHDPTILGTVSCHRTDPFGREKLMLIRSSHDMVEFATREGRLPREEELKLPEADGYFLTEQGDDFILYVEKGGKFLCYYRNDFHVVTSLEEVEKLVDRMVVDNQS